MDTGEQFLSLDFPVKGISLLAAFSRQQPGTARVGQNVRVFEVDSERGRGGSRPGLAKYVAAQLPNGAYLVQHLALVVDPAPEALLASWEDPSLVVADPSDNPASSNPADLTDFRVRNRGRLVRQGGSGIQPNRNV